MRQAGRATCRAHRGDPEREESEHDQTTLAGAPTGQPRAQPRQAEDPGDDAQPEWQDDDDQLLRIEAEGRGEVRAEDADHPDE